VPRNVVKIKQSMSFIDAALTPRPAGLLPNQACSGHDPSLFVDFFRSLVNMIRQNIRHLP
jgi:hypothetical protein